MKTHSPEYTAWLADLQPGDQWKVTEPDGSFRGTRHVITITIVRKTNTQLIASVIEYAPGKHWITPTERRYNAQRADHKAENRITAGGKAY